MISPSQIQSVRIKGPNWLQCLEKFRKTILPRLTIKFSSSGSKNFVKTFLIPRLPPLLAFHLVSEASSIILTSLLNVNNFYYKPVQYDTK